MFSPRVRQTKRQQPADRTLGKVRGENTGGETKKKKMAGVPRQKKKETEESTEVTGREEGRAEAHKLGGQTGEKKKKSRVKLVRPESQRGTTQTGATKEPFSTGPTVKKRKKRT